MVWLQENDVKLHMLLIDLKINEKGALLIDILATVSSASITEKGTTILVDELAVLRNKSVQLMVIIAPLIRAYSILKVIRELEKRIK